MHFPASGAAREPARASAAPFAALLAFLACALPLTAGAAPAMDPDLQQLRRLVRWVPAQVGGGQLTTPDPTSRLMLAHSAAARAGLAEVGLDFRDVYGVISAETSWVPRTGWGRNGVPSLGIAQFEPATARAVGLRDPHDAVAAVHAAAVLLKEAGAWSAKRIAGLNLTPAQRAAKLREGVSIYYNLSSRARQLWSGTNTHQLPPETRRHIANYRRGAQHAEQLHARLGLAGTPALPVAQWADAPTATATATAAPVQVATSTPRGGAAPAAPARMTPTVHTDRNGRKTWVFPQGTISWTPGSRS